MGLKIKNTAQSRKHRGEGVCENPKGGKWIAYGKKDKECKGGPLIAAIGQFNTKIEAEDCYNEYAGKS